MGIYWALTGFLMPNTIEAKREFFAYYSRPLWLNVVVGGVFLWSWVTRLGPAVIGIVAGFAPSRDRVVAWAFVGLIAGLTVSGPNVMEHNFFRYLQPLSMPLAVAGLCGLTPARRRAWLAASAVWAACWLPTMALDWTLSQRIVVEGQRSVVAWLDAHASPSASVLVHDAGLLSEETDLRLTDLVGLKTPQATELHQEMTGPSQGVRRPEAIHRLACRTAPEFYVAYNGWEQVFNLTDGLKAFGWDPAPVHAHRVPRPEGELIFTVYRLGRSVQCDHQGTL
jgi:hypothetical protein